MVPTDLPEGAKRARDIVREQHRREMELMNEQCRRTRRWMRIFAATSVLTIGILIYVLPQSEPGWRGIPDAPPLQRVTVITSGYIDADRRWHSFDNGEIITVHLWKP